MTRNIGIKVKAPKEEPDERMIKKIHLMEHYPVRGKLFEGKVVKAKGKDTVVLAKRSS